MVQSITANNLLLYKCMVFIRVEAMEPVDVTFLFPYILVPILCCFFSYQFGNENWPREASSGRFSAAHLGATTTTHWRTLKRRGQSRSCQGESKAHRLSFSCLKSVLQSLRSKIWISWFRKMHYTGKISLHTRYNVHK